MNDCSARGVAGSNEILGSPSIPFSTKSASFLQIGGHTQVPHPLKVIAVVRKGPPLPQPLGVLANRHGIDQSFVYCLFTSASKSPLSHRRRDTVSCSVLPSCRDVHGRGASATRWRCWPATSSWRIGSRRTVQKLIQQNKNRHDICQKKKSYTTLIFIRPRSDHCLALSVPSFIFVLETNLRFHKFY